MIKRVQENIFRYELFERGVKIVVGVSGGPDSVCLLDILSRLKSKYNLELVAAHVNYGLRGKDSERDEKFVKDLAKKYSLPFEIKRSISNKLQTVNLEERLRNIRYNFFQKVAAKYKAQEIAVAHNLNDQAETVLMRLLRGTGLRGLGAIKFKNAHIIRPLLNIPRKDILEYLRKNKISYRIDKTNQKSDFTRNKIRNELIPQLEKNFNPNLTKTLFKISQSVAEDYDFINRYAGQWLAIHKGLRISALNQVHPSIRQEVLRQTIEKLNPGLREIESAHIDEILKVLRSNKSKRHKISLKGLKIERIGDKLVIRK